LHPRTPSADAPPDTERDSLPQNILDLLSKSTQPMTTETVRSRLAVRKQRLLETLRILSEDGTIILAPKATCSNPPIPTENTPGSRL